MAEVREILINFVTDVKDIQKGSEAVAQGMGKASGEMDRASKAAGTLKTAAINAGIAAGQMALEWAVAGVGIATEANKIAANFDAVVGDAAGSLSDEIEDLAGHMGLAEHEAQQLLADTTQLGVSMGMTQQEAADFAAQMFVLAGDMSRFDRTAGSAEEIMIDLTKAMNGQTRGMAEYGVSLKSADINQRALADTGKSMTSELTQQDKAVASLALTTEQMSEAQGKLNEDIESGSTEVVQAKADIADMQVVVGEALIPIKKLALQGFVLLAEVLVELAPLIVLIGQVLGVLTDMLGVLFDAVRRVTAIFQPFIDMIKKVLDIIKPFTDAINGAANAVGGLIGKLGNLSLPSIGGSRGRSAPAPSSGGRSAPAPSPTGAPSPMSRSAPAPSSGGGGTVVNISVQAGLSNPQETAREIVDLLTTYTQLNGAVDIKVQDNG